MPNIKSAVKRMKTNKTKKVENKQVRSEMKTAIKKVESNNNPVLNSAYKKIDKALKKGVIKKNTAARKKSNVAKANNVK